jgi:methylated-DNA-protein-cysteine methyltransferase-like protein
MRTRRRVERSSARGGADSFRYAVYRVVRRIPPGRVATYGQVAAIFGHPRAARAVGTALRWLPRPLLTRVPWQRVINASGRVSFRGDLYRPDLQRRLLEDEGIEFDRRGVVDLQRFRWRGPRTEISIRLRLEPP